MKTMKLIIGMMLVFLTLTASAQLSTGENLSIQEKMAEINLFNENPKDDLMVEQWMYDLEFWTDLNVETEQLTELQEEPLEVESWMKSPFEAGVVMDQFENIPERTSCLDILGN